MAFSEFVYEQGIIGVTIGTITGYAISNFMRDLNKEFILKVLKYFKVSNAGLLSSLLEFLALMLIVYILYHTVLYPIFNKQIEKEKIFNKEEQEWKKSLLQEVKGVDLNSVYL